jgi:Tn7-like transposition protein D/TniQ
LPPQSAMSHPNLPRPLPDELLYSLVARCAVHIGYWSPRGLLRTLYRDRGALAVPDLPSSLGLLSGVCREQWGIDTEELALRHTLIGYYTHYLSSEMRASMIRRMLRRHEHLHLRLGICSSGVRRTEFFRLCRSCTGDDLARYGETYWRRSHHLPGIIVCAAHGERLLATPVPFRPPNAHEHSRARAVFLDQSLPLAPDVRDLRVALRFALQSVRLLTQPNDPDGGDFRPLMRQYGFVGQRNGRDQFQAAVGQLIPTPLLRAMFTSIGPPGLPTWLDSVRRKPRRAFHPLKHLLVRLVLDDASPIAGRADVKPRRYLSREPLLRTRASELEAAGLTTRAIAAALGVAWATASRLLQEVPPRSAPKKNPSVDRDRTAWTALLRGSPTLTRTQLRRQASALYARLYRRDRQWLMRQQGAAAMRRPAVRIDWIARDLEVAARVADMIRDVRLKSPPARVTRAFVLGRLQLRSLLAHRASKLPRTTALLNEQCETVEAFQVRRLVAAFRNGSDGRRGDWAWLRAARINSARYPDGGATLLAAARRICE